MESDNIILKQQISLAKEDLESLSQTISLFQDLIHKKSSILSCSLCKIRDFKTGYECGHTVCKSCSLQSLCPICRRPSLSILTKNK